MGGRLFAQIYTGAAVTAEPDRRYGTTFMQERRLAVTQAGTAECAWGDPDDLGETLLRARYDDSDVGDLTHPQLVECRAVASKLNTGSLQSVSPSSNGITQDASHPEFAARGCPACGSSNHVETQCVQP